MKNFSSPFEKASNTFVKRDVRLKKLKLAECLNDHIRSLLETESKLQKTRYNRNNRIKQFSKIHPLLESSYEVWLSDSDSSNSDDDSNSDSEESDLDNDSNEDDDNEDNDKNHTTRIIIPGNESKSNVSIANPIEIQPPESFTSWMKQDFDILLSGEEVLTDSTQYISDQFMKFSEHQKSLISGKFLVKSMLNNSIRVSRSLYEHNINILYNLITILVMRNEWKLCYKALCLFIRIHGQKITEIWGLTLEVLKHLNEEEFIETLQEETKLSRQKLIEQLDIPSLTSTKNPVLISLTYSNNHDNDIPFKFIENAIRSTKRKHQQQIFKFLTYLSTTFQSTTNTRTALYPCQTFEFEHTLKRSKPDDEFSDSSNNNNSSDGDEEDDYEEEDQIETNTTKPHLQESMAPLHTRGSKYHVAYFIHALLWEYTTSGQFIQFKELSESLTLHRPFDTDVTIKYLSALNIYIESLYIFTKLTDSKNNEMKSLEKEVELKGVIEKLNQCTIDFGKLRDNKLFSFDLGVVLEEVDRLRTMASDWDFNAEKPRFDGVDRDSNSDSNSDSDNDSYFHSSSEVSLDIDKRDIKRKTMDADSDLDTSLVKRLKGENSSNGSDLDSDSESPVINNNDTAAKSSSSDNEDSSDSDMPTSNKPFNSDDETSSSDLEVESKIEKTDKFKPDFDLLNRHDSDVDYQRFEGDGGQDDDFANRERNPDSEPEDEYY